MNCLNNVKKLSFIMCSLLLVAAMIAGCSAAHIVPEHPDDIPAVFDDVAEFEVEADADADAGQMDVGDELEQILGMFESSPQDEPPVPDVTYDVAPEIFEADEDDELGAVSDEIDEAAEIDEYQPAISADGVADQEIYMDINPIAGVNELFPSIGQAATPNLDNSLEILYKKTPPDDGIPVEVRVDQARTYPTSTKTNIPVATCYPLPKGTLDYVVGKEITYKTSGSTYKYRLLASGMRVETSDLKKATVEPKSNSITSLTLSAPNDGNTYIMLKMKQKVSYTLSYKADSVQILFHYTTKAPASATLKSNPMFTKATWSDNCKLELKFAKKGGFMGYKAYYDKNGNLIFRFNNPPSSIKNAKIAIDPGHGGGDIGGPGSNPSWQEKDITSAIAKKLAAELKSRGATVELMNNNGYLAPARATRAEKLNPDILISVHSNTAPGNPSAAGTEVYYFYPFSRQLASNCSANVSTQLNTNNRGARQSYYAVTLSPQFLSVLVETGFKTNKTEYKKLTNDKYQQRIATGIANSIEGAIKTAYTGKVATGSTAAPAPIPLGDDEDDGGTASVTGVKLDRSSVKVAAGKKFELKATVSPSNAKNKSVTWSSSNTSVATVTSGGVVTAKKAGSAKITVTTKDGGYKASCTVTVSGTSSSEDDYDDGGGGQVESMTITSDSETIDIGETIALEIEVDPIDADDPGVTWSSGNKSVATVDEYGEVTGLRAGTATITATTTDGSKIRSTCRITVTDQEYSGGGSGGSSSDSGISLRQAGSAYIYNDYLTIYPGEKQRVEILSDNDETVKNSDFTWKSSRTSVATVDKYGVVTARAVGDATITATASGYKLTCDIEVSRTRTKVTAITLDKTDTAVIKGKTIQLKATLTPSSANSNDVSWSSSNSRVASVDSSGRVTGVNPGTVTITVKSRTDSKVTAKCTVEVTRTGIPIDYIDMPYSTLEYSVGDEDQISVEIWPANATEASVTWKSSNTRVCTVDSKGNIKAIAKGKATITVTSTYDTSIYAECSITVY